MRLCMFHPAGHPLERGWVGRVDGNRVVQLAAQTLQSFFTGGGTAREHAEYPLAEVKLLSPVLHPPSIRIFDEQDAFVFANPAAVRGPGAEIPRTEGLALAPRVAAIIGAEGVPAAYTILAEWRNLSRRPPKDRDFALGLGPVAVTAETFEPDACTQLVRVGGRERRRQLSPAFDWRKAIALAADGTKLYAGDLVAGPSCGVVEAIAPGIAVDVLVDEIGELDAVVARD